MSIVKNQLDWQCNKNVQQFSKVSRLLQNIIHEACLVSIGVVGVDCVQFFSLDENTVRVSQTKTTSIEVVGRVVN